MKRRASRPTSDATLPPSVSHSSSGSTPRSRLSLEQRRGQAEQGGHGAAPTRPRQSDVPISAPLRGAALGHHLEQHFGDAPLGHGQDQTRQLDGQLVLAARLRAQDARQQHADHDAEDQRRQTAQALTREAHWQRLERARSSSPLRARAAIQGSAAY